jgi:hypothetical protein
MFSLINNNFTYTDLISKNNCLNYDSNNDKGFVSYKVIVEPNLLYNFDFKKINHDAKKDISSSNFNLKMTGFIIIQNKLPFLFRLTTTGPTKVYFNFSTNIVFNTSNDYQTTTLSKKFASIKKGIYTFYIERDSKASYSTTIFNLEYSNDNGSTWNSIDKLLINCTNNTLDKTFYANQFTQDMINKCANNITDTKCQNFYNNIEQYIIPNYSLANNLAVVDGQYDDWTSYEVWSQDSCGRQAKRSTRNYISEENGGIPITNPDLTRYQDVYCIADAALDSAWKLTSCKNSFPSELNREELKYYTGYLQDKFSKWMKHDNSTVSKQCFNSKITNGTTIKKGQKVYSPSDTYYLAYQSDGNICLYNSSGSSLWSAQTQSSTSTRLTFTDGNLILYNGDTVVWQTGSNSDTNSYLEINDDGRLYIKNSNDKFVLYYGTKYTKFSPDTMIMKSPNGDAYGSFKLYGDNAFFTYQPDGNLVLYDNDKNALWSSGTSGKTHTHLHMQTDGNLVLYNGSSVIWQSNTSINYELNLKIHNKYLLLVYGTSEILKIINYDKSIGDTEMSYQFAYYYLHPKAPNFVVRNYRGDVWKFPDNYYNAGNSSDPVGGTWRTGSEDPTDVMVNGKAWDYDNSLFKSWMGNVNTTTFEVGNTPINVNNNDDANFRWGRRKNNGLAQYDRIIDCTVVGYTPKSHRPGLWDPIAGTKAQPYIIAWYSGSGNKCPCYPLFQKKSQSDFASDLKGQDYIIKHMKTNPGNGYYDAILRYIGATDIYTMAGLFVI